MFTDAGQVFHDSAHRHEIAQHLYFYLMREPTACEVNRYLEIESRVLDYGEAAVIGAWVREQQEQKRLRTTEVQRVACSIISARKGMPKRLEVKRVS